MGDCSEKTCKVFLKLPSPLGCSLSTASNNTSTASPEKAKKNSWSRQERRLINHWFCVFFFFFFFYLKKKVAGFPEKRSQMTPRHTAVTPLMGKEEEDTVCCCNICGCSLVSWQINSFHIEAPPVDAHGSLRVGEELQRSNCRGEIHRHGAVRGGRDASYEYSAIH